MHNTYSHKAVEESDATLNSILNLIVEGVWDWNGNTGHVRRSPGWYHMLGYEVGVLKEDVFTWESIIHPDDYPRVMTHFELYITGKIDSYEIEYRCRNVEDDYIWIIDRGNIVSYNTDGTVARMIGAHHNINGEKAVRNKLIKQNQLLLDGNVTLEKIITKKNDELKKKNQLLKDKILEVEIISNTDSLTAIANRKKFDEELSKEMSRANRYNHHLSLVMFDIDFFKHINDSYGHRFGDTLLLRISEIVSNNLRDIDFFARWGGDEFVIIFPDLILEKALKVCEKLRILIGQFEIKKDVFTSCSFGVAQYIPSETSGEFLQRVDNCLYYSKKSGRNQVQSQAAI